MTFRSYAPSSIELTIGGVKVPSSWFEVGGVRKERMNDSARRTCDFEVVIETTSRQVKST